MDFSIVLTSYNYEKYIKDSLESCLKQETSKDFEIIVINDGSTDNTLEILKEYKDDPAVKILSIHNSGIEKASNIGFRESRGDYILRLDADDQLEPSFIEAYSEAINENNGPHFFYSDYFVMNSQGEITEEVNLPEFSCKEIFNRGDFLATGTVFKREVLENFGGYNESFRNTGLENYEFILQILKKGLRGQHIKKSLFLYRRHRENISEKQKDKIISYGKKLFQDKKYGSFNTNKYHPYKLEIN